MIRPLRCANCDKLIGKNQSQNNYFLKLLFRHGWNGNRRDILCDACATQVQRPSSEICKGCLYNRVDCFHPEGPALEMGRFGQVCSDHFNLVIAADAVRAEALGMRYSQ